MSYKQQGAFIPQDTMQTEKVFAQGNTFYKLRNYLPTLNCCVILKSS